MSFIGIITNSKNEEYMIKMLSNSFPIEKIFFITNKNINNVKNIRFETVVIDSKIEDIKNLKLLVSNAKYVILNADLNIDLKILQNLKLVIISYGFSNKATLTVSSVSENSVIICLQRVIKNIFMQQCEPQEIEVKIEESIDIHAIMCIQSLLLMYRKNDIVTI